MKWPFSIDQWGTRRAFACKAADCGAEAKLYLRAKLGSCNCETGVAEDGDLDRMSDFDLVGGEVLPLGAGRPITVAWMKGRSRAYSITGRSPLGKSAISVAFNDRCDMIVATVVLPHDRPATIEPGVMEFLNSRTVLHWAEVAMGNNLPIGSDRVRMSGNGPGCVKSRIDAMILRVNRRVGARDVRLRRGD